MISISIKSVSQNRSITGSECKSDTVEERTVMKGKCKDPGVMENVVEVENQEKNFLETPKT